MVTFDVTSFLLGLLFGGLMTASLHPVVGRVAARILAVILLGTGAGLVTWAVLLFRRSEPSGIGWEGLAQQNLAWGIGFLTAGVSAVVLSFFFGGGKADTPKA